MLASNLLCVSVVLLSSGMLLGIRMAMTPDFRLAPARPCAPAIMLMGFHMTAKIATKSRLLTDALAVGATAGTDVVELPTDALAGPLDPLPPPWLVSPHPFYRPPPPQHGVSTGVPAVAAAGGTFL